MKCENYEKVKHGEVEEHKKRQQHSLEGFVEAVKSLKMKIEVWVRN